MECIEQRGTTIQEFYRGSNILITGGTGFMGKVLLEKLLRSCPNLNNIYLLVRSKKGKGIEARVEEIFNDPLFAKLKEQSPKFRHKVIAVSGDCSFPGMGLSHADRRMLTEDVNIVFHGAATVRFDEKMRLAVAINVLGTQNILDLARDIHNLKAVIHVSTAYCNCHLHEIDEKFYNYPLTHHKLTSVVEGVNDKTLEGITPHLLDQWPNTYAFTKAMAEDLIKDQGIGLPIGIFRPAIVVATRSEPVSGWIDNVYGPTGVFVGAGTGFIKTLHGDAEKVANIVPVDMTVNALIASAWEVAGKPRPMRGEDIWVYNYVSSVQKPLNWGEFMDISSRQGLKVPSVRSVWCYSFTLNKYRALHMLYVYFLHFLPALFVDGLAVLMGKEPKLVKIYKKINRFSDVISYFSTRDWKFNNDNVQALWKQLDEGDRKLFDFDMDGLDWDSYFYDYVRGVRIYLLKDDPSTIPEGLHRQKRLYWIHQIVKIVSFLLFLKFAFMMLTWLTLREHHAVPLRA